MEDAKKVEKEPTKLQGEAKDQNELTDQELDKVAGGEFVITKKTDSSSPLFFKN